MYQQLAVTTGKVIHYAHFARHRMSGLRRCCYWQLRRVLGVHHHAVHVFMMH